MPVHRRQTDDLELPPQTPGGDVPPQAVGEFASLRDIAHRPLIVGHRRRGPADGGARERKHDRILCDDVGRLEIFYKDWGPKNAQPIVFHHGWPLSSDDWDAQMLFFAREGLSRRSPTTAAATAARAR